MVVCDWPGSLAIGAIRVPQAFWGFQATEEMMWQGSMNLVWFLHPGAQDGHFFCKHPSTCLHKPQRLNACEKHPQHDCTLTSMVFLMLLCRRFTLIQWGACSLLRLVFANLPDDLIYPSFACTWFWIRKHRHQSGNFHRLSFSCWCVSLRNPQRKNHPISVTRSWMNQFLVASGSNLFK